MSVTDSSSKEQQNQLLHSTTESYQKQIVYLLKLLAVAIDRLYHVTKEAKLHPAPRQPPSSPIAVREEMKAKEEEETVEAKLSCYEKLIAELEQTITNQKEEIAVVTIQGFDHQTIKQSEKAPEKAPETPLPPITFDVSESYHLYFKDAIKVMKENTETRQKLLEQENALLVVF